MATLAGVIRRAAKVALLVVAAAVLTLMLGQDARPTEAAATTRFALSSSGESFQELSRVILFPNGPSTTVYVWAVNVKDDLGVGAFQVQFKYNSSLISASNLNSNVTWLQLTTRTAQDPCLPTFSNRIVEDPVTGEGSGQVGCHTMDGGAPPLGPKCPTYCSGAVASFTVTPLPVTPPRNTTLNFAVPSGNPLYPYYTWLLDTGMISGGTVYEPELISSTLPSVPVLIMRCADFDGSGRVDAPNDILKVMFAYQNRSSDPDWDPRHDLNGDGRIDAPNDILGAKLQYRMYCTQ